MSRAAGKLTVLIAGNEFTCRLRARDPELLKLSVTVIVTLLRPATLGVPEIRPLDERVRPAGSDPALMANPYPDPDPPLAVVEAE